MGSAANVNDASFEAEVLKSSIPVLVDFWAPWCGPCRMLAPVVEELANENSGSVKVVKVNTDESPNTAMNYGINSIPTVIVFKGGQPVNSFVGLQPKHKLQAALDEVKG